MPKAQDITPRWLKISAAARYMGVCVNTMRAWADSGYVACRRTPGRHRLIDRESLDAPDPADIRTREIVREILDGIPPSWK